MTTNDDVWGDSHDTDWDHYARQVAAKARTDAAVLAHLNDRETDQ